MGYYATITEHYESVRLRASKSGKCACGKRLVRSTTFEQTLSPFNKKDGRLKTRSEIGQELVAERDNWKSQPIQHDPEVSYWKWPQELKDAYNKGEEITVKATCGAEIKVSKSPQH